MGDEGPNELTPGLRDELISEELGAALQSLEKGRVEAKKVEREEASLWLSRFSERQVNKALSDARDIHEKVQIVNRALKTLDSVQVSLVDVPARILGGIREISPAGNLIELPARPETALGQSDLLVNASGQPNIGSELNAELASAVDVDLICAFVIKSGVRRLRRALQQLIDRGGRVRVITTTYMGATEKEAVDLLHEMGAEVKVAFDARTTKLHAKAWLLRRSPGPRTAYVGSSNLSHTALFDGLEWNVRLSETDAAPVLEKIQMTFDAYWESEYFVDYDPKENGDELEDALKKHGRRSIGVTGTGAFAKIEIRPKLYQRRMLEALRGERERHERHRNLLVAATGTGKTVVAALDYRQLESSLGRRPSLLFVAHRQEILDQSIGTYRLVMRDSSFGELNVGSMKASGKHVFSSIQTLSEKRLREIDPGAFEVVVVDEFHHAAASSYDRLLSHLKPLELLGLTATPERLDGKDVTEWFGGRIAHELRLWDAIDDGFLVPFEYYGISDGVDLEDVEWKRGGYTAEGLDNVYTGNHARVKRLLSGMDEILGSQQQMRALGFCVSKDHARFMAEQFTDYGLDSVALTGDDAPAYRRSVLDKLGRGDLKCVFSVEVLGEGVDVPDVNCILLLRPTQSPTVFTQQLGRGLREAEGKENLVVIDLIGQHRKQFRFDRMFSALLDRRHGTVHKQVENGFPFLPSGCSIELDPIGEKIVMDNLKQVRRRTLGSELKKNAKELGSVDLKEFLERFDFRIEDLYRKKDFSWTRLRREAGIETPKAKDQEFEDRLLRNIRRISYMDDPSRNGFFREFLESSGDPHVSTLATERQRELTMLAWSLDSGKAGRSSLEAFFRDLRQETAARDELIQFLEILDSRANDNPGPQVATGIPLRLHARYSRADVVAALGVKSGTVPLAIREGILSAKSENVEAFFVDLFKTEGDYSPSTMYLDYAITPDLFHWESQSGQASHQPLVRRYIDHKKQGVKIFLFVRERKKGELGSAPFSFLGPADYVSHEGDHPVRFTWKLQSPIPAELYESARSVAVA